MPGVNLLSHDAGHLLYTLLGFTGDPHSNPLHIASYLVIIGGFWLLASAWRVLYAAQKAEALARTGPYARIRHPQYLAFILIMVGFLLQWPTLLTLAMFPVLVFMYVRLARSEERAALAEFGAQYENYMRSVPGFIPRLSDLLSGRSRRQES